MNEQLEKELNDWWKEYLGKKKEIEKTYKCPDNALSNRNPIETLNKEYMEKKKGILKKYGILK